MNTLTQLVLDIQQGRADISELYKPLTPIIRETIKYLMQLYPFYEKLRQGTLEDLEQNCWCSVLETLPKYDISFGCEYSTFINRQIRYALLNAMNTKDAQTQRRTISYDTTITDTDEEEIKLLNAIGDKNASIEFTGVERDEISKLIADAVDTLPDDLKAVFTARLHFNSLAEASRSLGISETVARTRYVRACQQLRKMLQSKDITMDFIED